MELFDWLVVFSCVFYFKVFLLDRNGSDGVRCWIQKYPDIHRFSSIQTQTNYYINDIPGPSEENQNPLVHPCTDM